MVKRQPKGTPVGGQFAQSRKPDGGDLIAPTGPSTPSTYGVVASLEADRDEAEREYETFANKVENGDIEDVENASYSDGLRAGYDLALAKIREAKVYISPDGNWGDASDLILLGEKDIEKLGGVDELSDLYEVHGDDLIDVVCERLAPQPKLVLRYNDWHDVAEAVGNLTDAWNATRNAAPEMDEAMGNLHFSYDTPSDVMVERIVAVQDAWRLTSHEGYDDPTLKINGAMERLGSFLAAQEPEAS